MRDTFNGKTETRHETGMRSLRKPRILYALLLAGTSLSPALAQGLPSDAEAAMLDLPPAALDAPAPVQLVPPDPVLPPEADAFRSAMRIGMAELPEAERAGIEGFYAARSFAPYWTAPGSDSITVLVAALQQSPAQGLPAARYDAGALAGLYAGAPAATSQAPRELAAIRAYLLYAGDLSAGVVRPRHIDDEIDLSPVRPSPAALLAPLATTPLDTVLKGFEPQSPDYRALVGEKARLEALMQGAAWGPQVADGPALHPGESDARVGLLRARLARLGYGAPSGAVAAPHFDASLVASVEQFQRDHGLTADGVVGQHTLDEINASARERLEQLVVNLERMRWLNRDFGPRYILVNIPDFTATVYEDRAPVWTSKVVVGEAQKTRSAEFSGLMTYMVINPSWHVPISIAKRVYLPQLQRDPGILARANMELMTQSGTVIDPRLIDFAALNGSFPFRIRQSPSDGNALGKVKFIFPNDHAIYMHDTPHRDLFAKDVRAFSNGCIRLADPDGLAHLLLRDQVVDPVMAFDKWAGGKAEKTVMLEFPIPVNLVYRTVFLDPAGALRYRDDVYGRDAKVFRALEDAGVTLPTAEG